MKRRGKNEFKRLRKVEESREQEKKNKFKNIVINFLKNRIFAAKKTWKEERSKKKSKMLLQLSFIHLFVLILLYELFRKLRGFFFLVLVLLFKVCNCVHLILLFNCFLGSLLWRNSFICLLKSLPWVFFFSSKNICM